MTAFESWKPHFDGRYPIYEQIVQELRRSLVKNEIKPGERIPSIRDMAMMLTVNTNTVQRAYQEMERQQLIYSQRGTGYFVMNDDNLVGKVKQDMVASSISQFVEEMSALGYTGSDIVKALNQHLEGGGKNGAANSNGSI